MAPLKSPGPNSSVSTTSSGEAWAPATIREVVADPHARYFGAELGERTLVAGDDARSVRPVRRVAPPLGSPRRRGPILGP